MKKKKLHSSLKWMTTIKMNNETINNALILACSWRDSGVVYFISTLHRGNETTIIQRQSGASKIDVQAPIIVEQYCKFMRNVDITD
jgi:uncharacterized protein YdeI (YjbR/CyaY-like superfamily)